MSHCAPELGGNQNLVASMIEFLFVISRHSNANFAKISRKFPEVVEEDASCDRGEVLLTHTKSAGKLQKFFELLNVHIV